MKKRTSDELRQLFLDYFKKQNHMIEPGASLVPINDPTLLWINSGVAALKKYFDGTTKPANPRIANAQKSIRTNDIENVGRTARHHTFFEMLGNFSIGDYFKKEAIPFAWEFLTSSEWVGFDKDKMYVSVHPDDEEAYRIWVDVIGLDPKRILKTEDNFWQIGEGPSGPNTELFYDRGETYDPEHLGEKLFFDEIDNDRYIEVWNVVFSQYDAKDGVDRKDFKELPQKNIDTGMGLERLACVVQGVETNFDIDSFLPILKQTERFAKYPYAEPYQMNYRVIADHIRTVCFAVSDGAVFSNDGRGYVLRRILRRAVRYGIQLGIKGAFMYQLVDTVADTMKSFYPYLQEKKEYVSKLVKIEEERFHLTLVEGEKLLNEMLRESENKMLSGGVAFKLYDTYGFPYELTEEIASEQGYLVDRDGFDKEMELQRERARNAREDTESMTSQSVDLMNFTCPYEFVGYQTLTTKSMITGIFKEGKKVNACTDTAEIAVDTSAFYAESGGQISDIGTLHFSNGSGKVIDVRKGPHKQHLHLVELMSGQLRVGDEIELVVDRERRNRIRANHSSLHLLQSALRCVLGEHIGQAGSYVGDKYARFDFTHYEKVEPSQLGQIEELVNEFIYTGHEVESNVMAMDEAKGLGAIALFDEKYGDEVRVVTMGDASIELCGGTHVSNTAEVGVFKILSEESIGSGVRRITVSTQLEAYHQFKSDENHLDRIANTLGVNSAQMIDNKLQLLQKELTNSKDELSKLTQQLLQAEAQNVLSEVIETSGLKVLVKKFTQYETDDLKKLVDLLKVKVTDSLLFFVSVQAGKLSFVVYCSEKAIEQGYFAGDLAKEAAQMTGGNGGGRKDIAQAGGKDLSQLDAVLKNIQHKLGFSL